VGPDGIHAAQRLLRLFRAEARRVGDHLSVKPMMALSGVRSSWLMLFTQWSPNDGDRQQPRAKF
jgi:hypothetical protein